MWKLNQFIPDDDGEREESLLEEESDGICSLSPTQRMYAFAASLAAGLILMFLASKRDKLSASADHLAFVMLPLHLSHLSLIVFAKPIKFALLFTFGNVLAVGSTAFLIGPGRQLGMMFDPIRIYATVIYIGCVVLALIFALLIHSKILTVFAIIFEICALIWYGLSYIPFARRMVSSLMIRLFDTEL
ncbi:protein transport protein SFT2 isoform X1 [Populus alba]|uniref:protein transport protein SFT2 isoform X1 n=1 Tax=Populus alba TaxID=43335 RepID=UPI003CC70AB1